MKIRKLSELYLLLNSSVMHFTTEDWEFGLCYEGYILMEESIFNKKERDILQNDIQYFMPKRTCFSPIDSLYGWPLDEQGYKDRKEFLKTRITELQNEGL